MKLRNGFVSNSSSSSFIITNKTNEDKTLVDFVNENPQLVERFVQEYQWHRNNDRFTQDAMIKSATNRHLTIPANTSFKYVFGDEDGDTVGYVLDYMLRDGGSSSSFSWEFDDFLR